MPGRGGVAGAGMGGRIAAANDIGGGGCGLGAAAEGTRCQGTRVDRTVIARVSRLGQDPATGVRMTPALSVGDRIETGAMPPGLELIPDVRPADPADVPGASVLGFMPPCR